MEFTWVDYNILIGNVRYMSLKYETSSCFDGNDTQTQIRLIYTAKKPPLQNNSLAIYICNFCNKSNNVLQFPTSHGFKPPDMTDSSVAYIIAISLCQCHIWRWPQLGIDVGKFTYHGMWKCRSMCAKNRFAFLQKYLTCRLIMAVGNRGSETQYILYMIRLWGSVCINSTRLLWS